MLKKRVSIVILFLVITIIAVYVILHRHDFEFITHVRSKYLFHQFLLTGVTQGIAGYITKLFLDSFQIRLKFKEWFGLAISTSLGNYLVPFRGGMAFKGIYLKNRMKFPYSKFISTVAASYILLFLSGGVLGIISLILVRILYGNMLWRLFAFFAAVSTIMIVTVILSPTIKNPKNRFTSSLRSILDGWNRIKKDKSLVIKVVTLLISNYIVVCYKLFYGYRVFSIDVAILPAFLMSLLTGFAMLIAITPGSLGIQEAAIGFISKVMGKGFNEGLIVAGILRVVEMTIVFTLGPIFMYLLLKKREVNGDIGEHETEQI